MESDMANQLVVENDQVEISAEEAQHNQEMIEKVEAKEITSAPEVQPQDKFGGDYDKLMQSYQELEKKLGQPTVPQIEPTEDSDLSIPKAPEPTAVLSAPVPASKA